MRIELKGLIVVGVVAASVSCGGGAPASSPHPPATAAVAPAGTVPPLATSTTELSSTAAGDFGVPECDSYMRKYKACLDSKVPDSVKPMLKQSFEQTSTAWRQAASTSQGKAGLAAGCVQAEAMAKQSMAPYGCAW